MPGFSFSPACCRISTLPIFMSVRMKRAAIFWLISLTCAALAAPSAYAESTRSEARSAKARTKASAKASAKASLQVPGKATKTQTPHKRRALPVAASAAALTASARESSVGNPEARLIDIYKLIGQTNSRDALLQAEGLVKDHPNFQLAQLVYGDLLAGRARPIRALGDVPDTTAMAGAQQLAELRQESQQRLRRSEERRVGKEC